MTNHVSGKLVRYILVPIKSRIKVKKKKLKSGSDQTGTPWSWDAIATFNKIMRLSYLCAASGTTDVLQAQPELHVAFQSYFLLGESPDGTASLN